MIPESVIEKMLQSQTCRDTKGVLSQLVDQRPVEEPTLMARYVDGISTFPTVVVGQKYVGLDKVKGGVR